MSSAQGKMRKLHGTLLGALALSLIATSSPAQEQTITDKARQYFQAGVNYMRDPDGAKYEEAYRSFKAAYAESPSWKILGNLGITAMKLERDGEAAEAFRGYLAGGKDELDEAEKAQVARDLQTLEASMGKLVLEVSPDGAVILDERLPTSGSPISNRYTLQAGRLEIGLRAGRHRITARLPGHDEEKLEIDVAPGSQLSHKLTLTPTKSDSGASGPVGPVAPGVEPAQRPVPTTVWIGLAATGAFAVGATVTGLMASGKRSDFDAKNNGTDPAGAERLRDDGKRLNLITDVLLGGAVVAGAVTAVLYLNRPEVPAERETAGLRFRPAIVPGGGSMWVTGAF
ncbi:MAG: hypothetical protein KF718_19260 [Polyangiaceae bacterium]|nr:hypothetical protein [Polyangiaceae bacterium]